MATLNPDDLADTPEPSASDRLADRGEQSDLQKFVSLIKGMLVGDDYEYASDTLRGILETVQTKQIMTDGQRRAVANIEAKPSRRDAKADHFGSFRTKVRRRWEDR